MSVLPEKAYLDSRFTHDVSSGFLYWKFYDQAPRQWNSRWAGRLAGRLCKNGYVQVVLDGKQHYAHRLIWKMVTGADPEQQIDHKNGNRSDNAWENLREASRQDNMRNRTSRGRFSKGVVKSRHSGRFYAKIKVLGKTKHLGTFDSEGEAHAAYLAAAKALHGEFFANRRRRLDPPG